MFRKMLVCTESGSDSRELATCISGLLDLGVKKCLVTRFLTYNEVVAASFTLAEEGLRYSLEGLRRQLQETGIATEAKAVSGRSYHQAYRLAEEHDCDLVVVDCRYDTKIGEILAGGIASSLIHHQTLPTLIVRMEVTDVAGVMCVRGNPCEFSGHALFPTDFSSNADHAFTYLEELVSRGLKRVTLMHVQDSAMIDPHLSGRLAEFNAIDRERLKNLEARLLDRGAASVGILISHGNPTVEILGAVRDIKPSLMIMGSQGRGFVPDLFLGSVSHNMARLAPVPLLLIPMPR